MHVLMACGISLCIFHLVNDVLVLAINEKMLPMAMKIKALTFLITLMWLIAATTLRFRWSGRVCSGEFGAEPFYLGKEADFLKNYLISLWVIFGLASCLGSIGACCMWRNSKNEYKNLYGY